MADRGRLLLLFLTSSFSFSSSSSSLLCRSCNTAMSWCAGSWSSRVGKVEAQASNGDV
uniref:Secreted protein n=1 Tax=Arundo donax TaxID=35708 RepID=A0A0A9AST4_ARUDO